MAWAISPRRAGFASRSEAVLYRVWPLHTGSSSTTAPPCLASTLAFFQEQRQGNAQAMQRIQDAATVLESAPAEITEWDEALIRQLVDTVKVVSADQIIVFLRGGGQIEQSISP